MSQRVRLRVYKYVCMDRSIVEIGRIGVILLNDGQYRMHRSSSTININKNSDNNKILIVLFLLIIQSTIVGEFKSIIYVLKLN